MRPIKLLLLPVLLILSSKAMTQSKPVATVSTVKAPSGNEGWKKSVTRRVYLYQEVTKNGSRIKQSKEGPLLARMLYEVARKGTLPVYDAFNPTFDVPLNIGRLDAMNSSAIDTIIVVDPKTGEESIQVKRNEFDYNTITAFHVLEDWTYDPSTAVTTIQIRGIAPVKHIYGDDGIFRGSQPVFWVKWNDAKPFLQQYSAYDTLNSIEHLLWGTYFRDSSMAADTTVCATGNYTGKTWTRSALRTIDLRHDIAAYGELSLENWGAEPLLSEMMFDSARKGTLKIYSTSCNQQHPLSAKEIGKLTEGKVDTQIMIDPITGDEIIKLIVRDFRFETLYEYVVKEQWKFDTENGKTEISYAGIAPVHYDYGYDGLFHSKAPFFWMKFDDVRPVLDEYAQYCPLYSVYLQLWNVRFSEKMRLTDRALFVEYK